MKKWYAVIGDPIAHSLSPYMHETWFKENGVDAAYIPVRVEPADLEKAFLALRTLGVSGFNITLPHKESILPMLDRLDETAAVMGAVNTVVFDGKQYAGFNTDGDGFVQSLFAAAVDLDVKVLVIGAGGAARGIAFALKRAGFADIVIANRTVERAEELAQDIDGSALTLQQAENGLGEFGIIIQTTSVGLSKDQALPISLENIKPGSIAADIIYNPMETPFLLKAKEQGCITINGIGMFVYQGAIAFEKWTGIKPDTEKMMELITNKLGGQYVNK
ncbi:shikimate dehydrogenase [Planomicrobium sp. CPCC 101079]|uniref:shikimate dehydrogenase n=1 Tax=Planomicrobium sp. CPCC 101079 TaxID=2599618 RepID=UPI0011B44DEF|nr:shikimate dehydrogenase [Planomicrobium sp. CPCC 101079]TWT09070.1 shikimate dehydrogenase [Planomicrobium sp. CPCC 101079]